MYEYIVGNIAELSPAYVVVEAGGVGYYLNISLTTFAAIEKERQAKLYTHFIVREDAQILYGFADKSERELFRMLISVSGVGGNTARMILSTYSSGELASIIAQENALQLKNVKGLGIKTAQKIIVELKDKMLGVGAKTASTASSGVYDEALAALSMLGFTRTASDKVLQKLLKANPEIAVEELIRLALKEM